MRTGLVILSDLHINSIHALCPPGPIELKNGGKYIPTAYQEQLWEWFMDFSRNIPRDIKRWFLVVNGDMVEGSGPRAHMVIRPSVAFQTELAAAVMNAFLDAAPSAPENSYYLRGTPWHTGGESDQDVAVGEAMMGVKDELTGARCFWELNLEINGKLLNFKHHPRGWSQIADRGGIAASNLAREITAARTQDGLRIPDLCIRSHVHHSRDSGYNPPQPRVHTTPCWKFGFDDYVNKKGFESRPDFGGLYIIVDDEDIIIRRKEYKFKEDGACQV